MKLTRKEAIELDVVLTNKKVTKFSDEVVFAMIDNKISLSKIAKEMDEAKRIASESCKPEELKAEGAETTRELENKWNAKFNEYMSKYLDEEVEVELSTLSKGDFKTIVSENGMTIGDAAILSIIRA